MLVGNRKINKKVLWLIIEEIVWYIIISEKGL